MITYDQSLNGQIGAYVKKNFDVPPDVEVNISRRNTSGKYTLLAAIGHLQYVIGGPNQTPGTCCENFIRRSKGDREFFVRLVNGDDDTFKERIALATTQLSTFQDKMHDVDMSQLELALNQSGVKPNLMDVLKTLQWLLGITNSNPFILSIGMNVSGTDGAVSVMYQGKKIKFQHNGSIEVNGTRFSTDTPASLLSTARNQHQQHLLLQAKEEERKQCERVITKCSSAMSSIIKQIRDIYTKDPWKFAEASQPLLDLCGGGTAKKFTEWVMSKIVNPTNETVQASIQSMVDGLIKNKSDVKMPDSKLCVILMGLMYTSSRYGITTYAKWLAGSKDRTLEDKTFNPFYQGKVPIQVSKLPDILDAEVDRYNKYFLRPTVRGSGFNMTVLELTAVGKIIASCIVETDALFNGLTQNTVTKKPTPQVGDSFDDMFQSREGFLKFTSNELYLETALDFDTEQVQRSVASLNTNVPGWRPLLSWTISKHPIKYTRLNNFIMENGNAVEPSFQIA